MDPFWFDDHRENQEKRKNDYIFSVLWLSKISKETFLGLFNPSMISSLDFKAISIYVPFLVDLWTILVSSAIVWVFVTFIYDLFLSYDRIVIYYHSYVLWSWWLWRVCIVKKIFLFWMSSCTRSSHPIFKLAMSWIQQNLDWPSAFSHDHWLFCDDLKEWFQDLL